MPAEARLDVAIAVTTDGHFQLEANFSAEVGVTVLFGPSGSGKSTALGAIAGLTTPTQGRIALGSEVWFDSTRKVEVSPNHRGVSLVFQSLALFPHMTALANVEYGIERSLPRPQRKERALAMLEQMRVAHLAHRRPVTFSGGEAQRVALARAFARTPRVVLLDEPFSALDSDLRWELCADVKNMVHELAIPAILVTHHRMEARTMADRMVLIEKGKIRAQGTAAELLPHDQNEDSRANAIRRQR